MISRELFCEVIRLIVAQEKIDQLFGKALQEVGSGPFVYGAENKYREALLNVLKDSIHDRYD